MVCRIAFLRRPGDRLAGRHISTQQLASGLRSIGVQATYTSRMVKADYYAVDCIDDLDLLPDVPEDRKIAWIRRDVYNLTERFPVSGIGHLFASSRFVADAWPDNRITVLPDPVAMPHWVPPRMRWGVLYVGRVCRRKGISLLLNAFRFLHPRWNLTIAGPVLHDFSSLVESNGLNGGVYPRVRFTGELSPVAIARLYWRSECLVLPSQFEPFGRPLVEAAGWNCTPIAIKGSGGPDEILGHCSGQPGGPSRLLAEHNPLALARLIENVTTGTYGLSRSECRQLARRYQPSIIAQQFMESLTHGTPDLVPHPGSPANPARTPAGTSRPPDPASPANQPV